MSKSKSNFFFLFAFVIGAVIEVTEAKPPSRMTAGEDARPGVFTWIVSIGNWNSGPAPYHGCGGAIITSRHILTAGHCVYDQDATKMTIRGGIVDLRDRSAITANVVKAFLYPDFIPQIPDVRVVDNDIAILLLDRELPLGGRLTKIPLPNSPPRNHQRGTVAGWGLIQKNPTEVQTMILKKDYVDVLDDNTCLKWTYPVRWTISPRRFCGQQAYGTTLPGDSGSPLVSEGKVIGLVSSSYNIDHVPNFYVNIYNYLNWIKSIIGNTH